jgi:hypothetical protein
MFTRIKRFLPGLTNVPQHNIMKLGGSATTPRACAYVYSSEDNLPPHPGSEWTRFVCIADSHSQTGYDMPPGDVLLHSGDLSSWGYPEQVMTTLKWIRGLDYLVKM